MIRAISPLLSVLLFVMLFAGCGSSSSVRIADDEAYRGQLAAAVEPVRFAGAPGIGTDQGRGIQSRLVRGLSGADIFASVIPLSVPGESNEAEIIIAPSVARAVTGPGRFERIDLRVVSRSKTTGSVGIDKTYSGRASGRRDALDDALSALARDLHKRYGNRAIF
ncbi:MAG: hypothetical protein K9M02_21520 [Thiohalocapsa sp.]|nr:hypothetical protein [Thiohalocapsa sp.]